MIVITKLSTILLWTQEYFISDIMSSANLVRKEHRQLNVRNLARYAASLFGKQRQPDQSTA